MLAKLIPGRMLHRYSMLMVLMVVFLSCAASTALYADQPGVEHQLSFGERNNQYVAVRLSLWADSGSLEVSMPAWTPGSYLIRDYAAHVERLRAADRSGNSLNVSKSVKNSWVVETREAGWVDIDYSVWAGELAVNASWVEADFALLNGAGIFLYSKTSRHLPQFVRVELPSEWSQVHSALSRPGQEPAFQAKDYDELVDSPFLLGNPAVYTFNVDEQDYALINQGEGAYWDGRKAADDVARVVASVQQFWATNPLERPYLFLNVISAGTGGLEHDNSTVMISSPWQMRNRDEYVRWLSLVAHEFFHVWNVRRLRPEALIEYDYEREVYTRELWLAEGLSSYYDNLLLFRSGLLTVDEYLTLLADEILKYESSPGRQVRSAEDASFDTWIKHYKPDANTINSDISYYRKGSLIGFVADTAIRKASDQQSSLDDIMREMYRLYGPSGEKSAGYPPRAFENLVQLKAGAQVSKMLETLLTTTSDPDVDAAFDYYGLRLERTPLRDAARASGVPIPAEFGLTWKSQESLLVVETVYKGSAAAAAGVLPGDELLAINEQRVNLLTIQDRMLRLLPGENAELLLVRNGRIRNLVVTVQESKYDKYRVTIKPDISKREKQRLSEWLGTELTFIKN